MKRILYVLIALFSITFSANANELDVANNSASELVQSDLCDPSDLILGPIAIVQGAPPNCEDYTFSVPPIIGCYGINLNGFYTFVVTDATGNTITFVTYTLSTSIQVTLPSYGQYFVHVQYSYVDENGIGQAVDVATDFYYDGCETPCDPNSLSLGPISVVQGPSMHCSDFIISVPPISGCEWTSLNGFYRFQVFESTDLVYPVAYEWFTQSNSTHVKLGYEGQYIVVVEYHYTDINGVAHTVTETLSFLFDNCDCDHIDPPTIFDCKKEPYFGSGFALAVEWNEPTNAAGYEYEVIRNDPNCCSGGIPSTNSIRRITRFSSLKFINYSCFSIRIRAICADGIEKSEWSETFCSCEMDDLTQIGSGEKSLTIIEDAGIIEDSGVELTLAPNPAKNHVDVTMSGMFLENPIVQPEMVIYDLSGKEVYRSDMVVFETKRVDLSLFKSGVYLISLVDNGVILSTEKLIVE